MAELTNAVPALRPPATPLTPELAAAVAAAEGYLDASMAANTQRAYAAQWKAFCTWCTATRVPSLQATPQTIAAYLAALAGRGRKIATIDSARAAIRKAHEAEHYDDPTAHALVKQTLKGIRRTTGTTPAQKAPLLTADLRRLLSVLPTETLKGKRDRALLLLGFATGSRRSELVALGVEDIVETPEGLLVTIRRSKTDQEGRGYVKGIVRGAHPDTCPIFALREWLQAAGITDGALFRRVGKGGRLGGPMTAQSVALILKAAAARAKLDLHRYSGHSLRAGFVTQAAKNGVAVPDIMRQTGHTSTETVNRYVRKATVFEDNASARLGL